MNEKLSFGHTQVSKPKHPSRVSDTVLSMFRAAWDVKGVFPSSQWHTVVVGGTKPRLSIHV